jgi:hypothetical protein
MHIYIKALCKAKKMPQSHIEEGRRKLKGKLKGWEDTIIRKG